MALPGVERHTKLPSGCRAMSPVLGSYTRTLVCSPLAAAARLRSSAATAAGGGAGVRTFPARDSWEVQRGSSVLDASSSLILAIRLSEGC